IQPTIAIWKDWITKTLRFETYFVDNADTILVVTLSATQIYVLTHLYQQNIITAGEFAFVSMMTLKIHTLLDTFLQNILWGVNPCIAQIRSSYTFIYDILDVQDPENPESLTDVQGKIEYQNVTFGYDRHRPPILRNFNLIVTPGERLGIVGRSGSGKTTLIKCLLRYFDISSGKILIDGHDIKNITQKTLRALFSFIPQDISLLHRSLKENLLLARPDATDEDIYDACKKAHIHDDILAMPLGYETVVGERGIKLSGGQRQRIAIARALLKKTSIWIFDEATSNLDTKTEQPINDLLKTSTVTIIAIAHRLSTLKNMDRIIVLDQGTIAEVGTHADLIKNPDGLYKKLWDMQASI
ncbi:MAG: ATP-binding cassette domain-containing protein, partial [Candidatus Babeliales bacterium]